MPWLINRNGLHFLFFSNLLINLWSATWTGSFANLLDGWQMLLNRGEKGEGLSVYVWILSAWIPLVVLFYYSLGHWYYCSGWRGSRVPAHRRECRVTCEISLHRKPVCFFSLYLHFKSSFHNLSSLSPPIAMRKVGGSISWRSVTAIWNLLSETVDIRQLAAQEWKWNEWWRIREKERETCDKLEVSDRITGRKNPDVASTCFFGWKTTLAQGSWKKDLRATPSCCCWGLFLNKPNIWVKYTRVAIYDHSTRILC